MPARTFTSQVKAQQFVKHLIRNENIDPSEISTVSFVGVYQITWPDKGGPVSYRRTKI